MMSQIDQNVNIYRWRYASTDSK